MSLRFRAVPGAIGETLVSDTVLPLRLGVAMAQARVRVGGSAGMLAEAIARWHGGAVGETQAA